MLLAFANLILGNRLMRILFVAYAACLHIFVFGTVSKPPLGLRELNAGTDLRVLLSRAATRGRRSPARDVKASVHDAMLLDLVSLMLDIAC
jgi:hypothetical protein